MKLATQKILLPTYTVLMVLGVLFGSNSFGADVPPATTDYAPAVTNLPPQPTQAAFSKLEIRKAGLWMETVLPGFHIDGLSDASLATIGKYSEFTIDSLKIDAQNRFLATVTFNYKTDIQSYYVFGYVTKAGKKMTAVYQNYAEADMNQRMRREQIQDKMTSNIPSRNNQDSYSRVREEDKQRNKAVEDAVNVWLGSAGNPSSAAVASSEDFH
jgi:hypothetical protein